MTYTLVATMLSEKIGRFCLALFNESLNFKPFYNSIHFTSRKRANRPLKVEIGNPMLNHANHMANERKLGRNERRLTRIVLRAEEMRDNDEKRHGPHEQDKHIDVFHCG